MYIKFRIVKDRKQKEHPLRLRDHGHHLRILAILSGHKPKHLACVRLMVHPESVHPTLARCRERLSGVCEDPEQLRKLLAQIEERLSREVEATAKAREEHRRELEAAENGTR
jgi:hypothetical protein